MDYLSMHDELLRLDALKFQELCAVLLQGYIQPSSRQTGEEATKASTHGYLMRELIFSSTPACRFGAIKWLGICSRPPGMTMFDGYL